MLKRATLLNNRFNIINVKTKSFYNHYLRFFSVSDFFNLSTMAASFERGSLIRFA